jgi:hypothetical protein
MEGWQQGTGVPGERNVLRDNAQPDDEFVAAAFPFQVSF